MVAILVDLINRDLIAEGVGTVWPLVNTSSDPNTRERLGKDYRRLSEGVSMRAQDKKGVVCPSVLYSYFHGFMLYLSFLLPCGWGFFPPLFGSVDKL